MAKKSRKRLPRHERSEPGCMWNLMSLFDFRHARSTKRLITDSRREANQGIGRLSSKKILASPAVEAFEKTADIEESQTPPASVKELMEVEMFKDQGFVNQSNDCEPKLDEMALKQAKRNQKKKRNRFKSSDMDVMELDAVEFLCENFGLVPDQANSDYLDLETVVDELVRISQRDTTPLNDNSLPSCGQDVGKLVAALKLVLNERRRGGKCEEEGDTFLSKEFADAQEMLSSNRGSFLKLLKDQNSVLVKHFQKLVDAHVDKDPKTGLSPAVDLHKEKPANLKLGDLSSGQKHWSFFRRSRSLDSYPMEWDKDSLSPNKIVILRPGREGAQSVEPRFSISSSSVPDNKSYFSFTGIKRKLWNAMGKERQAFPSTLKVPPKQRNGMTGYKISLPSEISGWSSPNRDHFYTERFAISSRDKRSSVLAADAFQFQRLHGPNIYNEAKKHLSDMLKNRGGNIESMEGQFSKSSLGRTLSLTEYSESPCRSPRMFDDDVFAAAEMRLSQPGLVKSNTTGRLQEYVTDSRKLNLESPHCSSDMHAELSLKDGSLAEQPEVHEVSESEDKTGSRYQEADKVVYVSPSNTFDADTEKGYFRECLQDDLLSYAISDLHGEGQSPPLTTSPSRSIVRSRVENFDYAIDKMERPSPVSVLETLFTDENVSPANTSLAQSAERDIQPRHIQFEERSSPSEPGICTRISLEDEESAFEYVEAVLLGSCLNWDEFLLRWLSSHDILDSSLFDEVELFSSRPHHDQKLLFDCANDALKNICDLYFRCFPSLSGTKTDIHPMPRGMDLIQEIWKRVEGCLFPHPWTHSLDQLVKTDLERSRNWINLDSDVQLICFLIGETILDELAEDSALSLLDGALV